MISAEQALSKLKQGNQRFSQDMQNLKTYDYTYTFDKSLLIQNPFAVILGCSDSRVPVEIIFDQGFGDLFIIRIAGNTVSDSQKASIEFALKQFNIKLVVVLGHSTCGAIRLAVDELQAENSQPTPYTQTIVSKIQPCIKDIVSQNTSSGYESIIDKSIDANIQNSVNKLKTTSVVIQDLLKSTDLQVVGAKYTIKTGKVDFKI